MYRINYHSSTVYTRWLITCTCASLSMICCWRFGGVTCLLPTAVLQLAAGRQPFEKKLQTTIVLPRLQVRYHRIPGTTAAAAAGLLLLAVQVLTVYSAALARESADSTAKAADVALTILLV